MKKNILFTALLVMIPSMPISVTHEWDRLEECVVGGTERREIPSKDSGCCARILAWFRRLLDDPDPDMYQEYFTECDQLVEILRQHGVVVHRSPRLGGYGSSVWVRDPVIVIGDTAIEVAMTHSVRLNEKFVCREALQRLGHKKYIAMPVQRRDENAVNLEGGDVLLNGKEIYVGVGGGSNLAGVEWLQAVLGEAYRVIPIPLKKMYHLDMALALLRPHFGIVCRDALKEELPESLRTWDFVEATREEAESGAVNVLILDENTVVAGEHNHRVIDELRSKGVNVIASPAG